MANIISFSENEKRIEGKAVVVGPKEFGEAILASCPSKERLPARAAKNVLILLGNGELYRGTGDGIEPIPLPSNIPTFADLNKYRKSENKITNNDLSREVIQKLDGHYGNTKEAVFVMPEIEYGTSSAEIYFPYNGIAVNVCAVLGSKNDFSTLSDISLEIQSNSGGTWNSVGNIVIPAGYQTAKKGILTNIRKGMLRVNVSECETMALNASITLSVNVTPKI